MYWMISIKMYSHDRTSWYWAHCCRVESNEMLGIVEDSLKQYQEVKVEKFEYKTSVWVAQKL